MLISLLEFEVLHCCCKMPCCVYVCFSLISLKIDLNACDLICGFHKCHLSLFYCFNKTLVSQGWFSFHLYGPHFVRRLFIICLVSCWVHILYSICTNWWHNNICILLVGVWNVWVVHTPSVAYVVKLTKFG